MIKLNLFKYRTFSILFYTIVAIVLSNKITKQEILPPPAPGAAVNCITGNWDAVELSTNNVAFSCASFIFYLLYFPPFKLNVCSQTSVFIKHSPS